jgi:hypothetical protein
MHIQEQRSSNRFPVESTGCAIINGSNVDLKTHDVSQGGALVEFLSLTSLKKGMKLRICLTIGFTGRAIVCRVNTRNNRTLYSLVFDRFDFYSDLALSAYFVKHEHHLSEAVTIH